MTFRGVSKDPLDFKSLLFYVAIASSRKCGLVKELVLYFSLTDEALAGSIIIASTTIRGGLLSC